MYYEIDTKMDTCTLYNVHIACNSPIFSSSSSEHCHFVPHKGNLSFTLRIIIHEMLYIYKYVYGVINLVISFGYEIWYGYCGEMLLTLVSLTLVEIVTEEYHSFENCW